ncbi:MAG: hypothetical protein AAF518_27730, partial [Spirochaetota bacterium]
PTHKNFEQLLIQAENKDFLLTENCTFSIADYFDDNYKFIDFENVTEKENALAQEKIASLTLIL